MCDLVQRGRGQGKTPKCQKDSERKLPHCSLGVVRILEKEAFLPAEEGVKAVPGERVLGGGCAAPCSHPRLSESKNGNWT